MCQLIARRCANGQSSIVDSPPIHVRPNRQPRASIQRDVHQSAAANVCSCCERKWRDEPQDTAPDESPHWLTIAGVARDREAGAQSTLARDLSWRGNTPPPALAWAGGGTVTSCRCGIEPSRLTGRPSPGNAQAFSRRGSPPRASRGPGWFAGGARPPRRRWRRRSPRAGLPAPCARRGRAARW